jgi:predicted alpha/beta-fold hydrolase
MTNTGSLMLGRNWNRDRTPAATPSARLASRAAGHFWTIAPTLFGSLLFRNGPAARPFRAAVQDPLKGAVRLSGLLLDVPESDTLVLIVHGLAGNAGSAYCGTAAAAAEQAGYASVRLSLRGADLSGEDLFHGGLTDDMKAALASPDLARYRKVFLLGYSVGGHIALRAAIELIDSRIRAVAAICPPLDLDAATAAFDEPSRRLYRRHISAGLDKTYAAIAARRFVPVPPAVVRRARSCRERDALTVVPRFGFASESEYYERASVSAIIHRLAIPSLMIASAHDPIIPAQTLRSAIGDASSALTVRWVPRGGHVFFPSCLDLGQGGPLGLEPQVMAWLGRQ